MKKRDYYRIKILKDADEILETQGAKSLTITNIVNRCNISKRSFYECFTGKQELLNELKKLSNLNVSHMDERQMILKAAEQTICRDGFNNVSLEMLAQAAGLRRGDIYKHFNDKYDILECCIEVQFDQLKKAVGQIYEMNKDNPTGFIQQYVKGMGSFLDDSHGKSVYTEIWSHLHYRKRIRYLAVEMQNYTKELFAKAIATGVRMGIFRDDMDCETMSVIMLITTNGMSYYLSDSKSPEPQINQEVIDGLIEFMLSRLSI